jgi:hypothetical protein
MRTQETLITLGTRHRTEINSIQLFNGSAGKIFVPRYWERKRTIEHFGLNLIITYLRNLFLKK